MTHRWGLRWEATQHDWVGLPLLDFGGMPIFDVDTNLSKLNTTVSMFLHSKIQGSVNHFLIYVSCVNSWSFAVMSLTWWSQKSSKAKTTKILRLKRYLLQLYSKYITLHALHKSWGSDRRKGSSFVPRYMWPFTCCFATDIVFDVCQSISFSVHLLLYEWHSIWCVPSSLMGAAKWKTRQ